MRQRPRQRQVLRPRRPLVLPKRRADMTEKISADDFFKVEMRVGLVKVAEKVKGADKLLRLEVDIGTEVRQVVAGIAKAYDPEKLVGTQSRDCCQPAAAQAARAGVERDDRRRVAGGWCAGAGRISGRCADRGEAEVRQLPVASCRLSAKDQSPVSTHPGPKNARSSASSESSGHAMAHEHSRGFGLLQLRVLSFGLLVDGDVGIGVFPEGEEVLIRRAGLVASSRMV